MLSKLSVDTKHLIFNASAFIPHIIMIIIIIYGLATIENKSDLSRKAKTEKYLKLYINWVITGAGFAYGFGHLFMGDKVAKSIGWDSGSPFQKEIGFANLSFAIMALYIDNNNLSIDAYKACALGYLAFLSGCLLVHILEIIKYGNYSFNNIIAAPLFSIMNIIYCSYLLSNC
jgi:hypothetical protein